MKKISLFLIAICMMAGTLHAQNMYVRLGVGGGVGLKQYDGGNWANETQTNSTHTYDIKSMGLGGGFNANLAFGYMLSDNFGFELGVNEFIGLNKKVTSNSTASYDIRTEDRKISGMMLQIVPAIVLTPGLEKLNPYARIGMIIGILPSVIRKYNTTRTVDTLFKATSTTETYKEKEYGGVAIGFTVAGGADFQLNDKISLYGELVFNGITYAPTKGKIKEWTRDGVDQLPTEATKYKEWTYEKSIDSGTTIPNDSPGKQPKTTLNFSNVELNIGIKLHL